MMLRLAALTALALGACAKKEAAPAADAGKPAAALSEAALAVEEPAADETVATLETENAAMACPVLDSRNWRAFTTPDGDGNALTIEGEVDLPTPGYTIAWREGPADRAFPPGLRVYLDASPPDGAVMQVVSPTPVSWSLTGANAEYRVIYVLCDGEAIAEIADVKPKG